MEEEDRAALGGRCLASGFLATSMISCCAWFFAFPIIIKEKGWQKYLFLALLCLALSILISTIAFLTKYCNPPERKQATQVVPI